MSDTSLAANAIDASGAELDCVLELRELYYRHLGWDISGENGIIVKVTGMTDTGCNPTLISLAAAKAIDEQIEPILDELIPQLVLRTIVPERSITPIGYIPKVTMHSPDLGISFSMPCYVVDLVDVHLIIGLYAQGMHHITKKMDRAIDEMMVPKYLGDEEIPNNVVAMARGGHARDGRTKSSHSFAEERDDVAKDMKQNGLVGLNPCLGGHSNINPMVGMGGWVGSPYGQRSLQGCLRQGNPPMRGFVPSAYSQQPGPLFVSYRGAFGSTFSSAGSDLSAQLPPLGVCNGQLVRQQVTVPATALPAPGILSRVATFASDATTATGTTQNTVFSAASDASSVLSEPTVDSQKP